MIAAVRISNVADHPQLIATIARWHWDAWGHEDPDGSLTTWTAGLRANSGRDGVPMTFVALTDGGVPVGSVSLVQHDLPERDDLAGLTPWLAGLFVLPEHRRRGIGSALVHHAEAAAAGVAVPRLYLYTETAQGLYTRLGWRALRDDAHAGEPITIMAKRLA